MDLYATATKLLDLVSQQLTTNGVVLPDRVYVAPGVDLAFDCEQLTVHLSRIISNFPGQDTPYPTITHKILRRSAEYFITLVRCVPTMNDSGDPPPVDQMNAASTVIMTDMNELRKALENIEHQHLLMPVNVPVSIGPAITIGPLGGFAASQGSYTCEFTHTTDGWVG